MGRPPARRRPGPGARGAVAASARSRPRTAKAGSSSRCRNPASFGRKVQGGTMLQRYEGW